MNQQLGGVILLVLSSVLFLHDHVRAQSQTAPSSGDAVSNFQPSLAVVIGILGIMFLLTFFLLMYAKFCQRRSASAPPENQFSTLVRSRSRFSGIDKTVIESLPFFRFSSLKGSKQGLECAVCLSKFEDVEILRLLPKCKHAFHIDCIDHWLEKHSTCPICRHRVNPEDHTTFTYSNSLRRLANQSELGDQESNIEVFVQREEEHHGSSRFSVVGSSFRKTVKEEELLIQNGTEDSDGNQKGYQYHKHNHKITISDVVFKHRWSNVSSSDLMFLNSEMLNDTSSNRFSNLESNADIIMMSTTTRGEVENEQIMNIKEEMERKISFESKVGALNNMKKSVSDKDPPFASSHAPKCVTVNPGEKRSMSEITAVSRFGDLGMKIRVFKDSSSLQNNLKEERMRQIWFPIARRTAQWFVNREIRSQQSQNKQQPLDV